MDAVVFDCDGVLVDSERINNGVFAELLTRAGLPMTMLECAERYMGRPTPECVADVELELGRPIGFDLSSAYEEETIARQRSGLAAIAGVREVLERLAEAGVPVCVASSGSPVEIAFRLGVTGLDRYFGGHLYSASMVARGKPAPDLFLYAAARLGVDPSRCVLVEDSPAGVRGGVAAGMHVIGYADLAPPQRLLDAGAAAVVADMSDLGPLLQPLVTLMSCR